MFSPLPMRYVSLMVVREQAPDAAMVLAREGVFEPRIDAVSEAELSETPAHAYREKVMHALSYLDKILQHYQLDKAPPVAGPAPPTEAQLDTIDATLKRIWSECSARDERIHRIQEQIRHLAHLSESLDTFSRLDIDLALLHGQHRFLDLRVGTVPPANRQRLSDAVTLAGYHLKVFEQSEEYENVLLLGPVEHADQITQALESAGWQPLPVPEELRGHPEQVRQHFEEQLKSLRAERQRIEDERGQQAEQQASLLQEMSRDLGLAFPYANLAESLHGHGGLALVTGWVPQADVATLQIRLAEQLGEQFYLKIRPPRADERQQVPSAFRHPHWLSPFVGLVKNYGVPRYGEFDPTLLFTITYIAMFGMMFGDVGHGLTIVAAAPLLRKRQPRIIPFVVLCGLSSVLFGWLYGSIFGFEHIITPLWISPLSDPVYMLQVSMLAGVGFILLATTLSIRNHLAEGDWHTALLSGNGVAGLTLYLALLWLAWRMVEQQAAWPGLLLAAPALALVLVYSARENRSASGVELVLILLVEAFETVMNYISGTLSYLRLAAFSLNHVALAIAVFTLAGMLETTGYWLTVVIGNVFILVLEGGIVLIQALRLEYYEGFSRFFRGDGREFQPLRLGNGGS